jgi:transcriptional regulator with XRE-family HTH domain
MASSRDCQTQDALARKSGVGQATIGRILRGEVDPQIGTMTFLAVALGMTLKTLAAVAEGEKAVKHAEVDDHDAHGESAVLRFAVEALDRVADQLDDAQNQLARFRKEGQR